MIGRTIGNYRIIDTLGQGGMGVVYKAQDVKLDRFVALKFLPPHLSRNEAEKKRFIREAKAASALDHPNICTIYEINETAGGQLFISMACYGGCSLDERIANGPLAIDEAIDIAIQVARGLAKAHSKQIVHRDIKPANIIVTDDGTVKIVDFGIAKLSTGTRITKAGTTIGTLAYMSPEQAQGSEVDHRTDIWSLAVVLYEMLAGTHPFRAEHEAATVYCIVHQDVEPVASVRPDVSPLLEGIVEQAMRKEPDRRHQDMVSLERELESARNAAPAGSTATGTVRQASIPAIAVLPFANMSADVEQEYFCDGMAEEITNSLAKMEGLRVAARTSAFEFKDRHEDVRDIGMRLGVDMVLEGSVRKAGSQLRITAQLIKTQDGFHVWSERYDRELEDVFAIQDDIAKSIVTALKIRLNVAEEAALASHPTENLEAYDAYLRGIHLFNQRTKTDNRKAIEMFERAIELDPAFAQAHARLGYACVERSFTYRPGPEWEEKALDAIEKALALDSGLAEAHAARGNLLWTKSRGFPHREAIAEYRRAIEIQPNLAEAHNELGRALWHVGALNAGHAALRRALEIDPTYVDAQYRLAMLELHRGNYESALGQVTMMPSESMAYFVDPLIAMCHLYLGRSDEARRVVENVSGHRRDEPPMAGAEAILLATEGNEAQAIERINVALEGGKHFGHFHHTTNDAAAVFALLNDTQRALDLLEETAGDGFPCYSWFELDPMLENLRSEPRFKKMIRRMRDEWGEFETI